MVNCKMTTDSHLCPPESLQCHFAAPPSRVWSPFPKPLTLDCTVTCFGEWDIIKHNIKVHVLKSTWTTRPALFQLLGTLPPPQACLLDDETSLPLPTASRPQTATRTETAQMSRDRAAASQSGGNGELSLPKGSSLHQLLPTAVAQECASRVARWSFKKPKIKISARSPSAETLTV